jgi:hypothetical protein
VWKRSIRTKAQLALLTTNYLCINTTETPVTIRADDDDDD